MVDRAAFFSNMFSGNMALSSFQLVRGYSPSVMGIPKTIVTEDILQAHKEQVAARTLQILMNTRAPNALGQDMFKPGDAVWVFYKSTKQDEKVECLLATVVIAEEHFLVAKNAERGRLMRVAYEDVHIAPRSDLTKELL